MKKIIPFLLAMLLIVSCGNDDNVLVTDDDITTTDDDISTTDDDISHTDDDFIDQCEFCIQPYNGLYEITFSDDNNGLFNFNNKAFSVSFNFPNQQSLYLTSFDFDFQDSDGLLQFDFSITGTLSGNTLTYTNRTASFAYASSGSGSIFINQNTLINGTITFSDNYTTASGTLNLSGGVTGTITFSATL